MLYQALEKRDTACRSSWFSAMVPNLIHICTPEAHPNEHQLLRSLTMILAAELEGKKSPYQQI
jgi:hypothetical protein